MSILDKASLVQIPSGYKNGKLYSVKPTPTYGSELVTNGDFSGGTTNWSSPDYNSTLSIVSGQMKIVSTITLGRVVQGITTVVGKKYLATATITNIDSSTGIQLKLSNGSNLDGAFFDSSFNTTTNAVIITKEFTATATTTYIGSSHGTSIGQSALVDNVSVKEITNIGDFDFSRASSGTRVNSEGLIETAKVIGTTEEVINGDFSSGGSWSGSASISSGQLTKTSGGLAYQSGVVTANKYYKVVVDVESLDGATQLYFGGNQYTLSVGVQTIEAVGGTSNTFVGFNNGYSSSSGSVFNSISVIQYIENDVPRLDYSGGASCASLLLEPQRTNLITYSEDFSQWINSNIINTNQSISLSGLIDADEMEETLTNTYQYSFKFMSGLTTSTNYVLSTFVKDIDQQYFQMSLYDGANYLSANFDLTNETITTATNGSNYTYIDSLIEDFGNGWYKVILIFQTAINNPIVAFSNNNSSTAGYIPLYTGTGKKLLVWGAMLEQGSFPTSYIPSNSGSSTTRTADVCNNAGTSATFNSTEGVLFAECSLLSPATSSMIISLSDGSSNRLHFEFFTSNRLYAIIENGSLSFNTVQTITQTNNNKIAFKYSASGCKLYINGTGYSFGGLNFSSGTLDTLNFAASNGTSSKFYGKCKQLIVFDEALSDSELATLTS